jgi:hypothetical protein
MVGDEEGRDPVEARDRGASAPPSRASLTEVQIPPGYGIDSLDGIDSYSPRLWRARRRQVMRTQLLGLISLAGGVGVATAIAYGGSPSVVAPFIPAAVTAIAVLILVAVLDFAITIRQFARATDDETTALSAEATDGTAYFHDLVSVNLTTLRQYYKLVGKQADRSFGATLLVSVGGFVLLVLALIVGFNSERETLAFITAGSGLVTEFIAAIFFALYARNVRQLKAYHDSLLVVQNILLALRVVSETEDTEKRTQMASEMLRYLVARPDIPLTVSTGVRSPR